MTFYNLRPPFNWNVDSVIKPLIKSEFEEFYEFIDMFRLLKSVIRQRVVPKTIPVNPECGKSRAHVTRIRTSRSISKAVCWASLATLELVEKKQKHCSTSSEKLAFSSNAPDKKNEGSPFNIYVHLFLMSYFSLNVSLIHLS